MICEYNSSLFLFFVLKLKKKSKVTQLFHVAPCFGQHKLNTGLSKSLPSCPINPQQRRPELSGLLGSPGVLSAGVLMGGSHKVVNTQSHGGQRGPSWFMVSLVLMSCGGRAAQWELEKPLIPWRRKSPTLPLRYFATAARQTIKIS